MKEDAQEEKRPIQVMAKPVGSRCNMRCSYCYYLDKGKYSSHAKQLRMNLGLLERMICQTIEACPGPVVSFTWHGGEPTLAGIDFYEAAVELERKYLPAGWQVWNNLQTNGLLIDEVWCRFLKANAFDVGVSIDGTQAVHDANRPDLGGRGTWERICRSIRRLEEAGIEPDLLCTVNAASLSDPVGVYRALRDLGTGWIQFIPIIVRNPETGEVDPVSVTPEGYGDFLCAVFDEWVSHDLGTTDVQFFAECARVLAGGQASLCTMAPTCGRVLIAEEDGSIYSCDHFVDPDHRVGNLKNGRIGDVAGSAFQVSFGQAKRDTLTAQCLRCPYLACCSGGCPKDRFGTSADGEPGQYYLCAGLEKFFSHAVPILLRAEELSRSGKDAGQIMRQLKKEARKPGA